MSNGHKLARYTPKNAKYTELKVLLLYTPVIIEYYNNLKKL